MLAGQAEEVQGPASNSAHYTTAQAVAAPMREGIGRRCRPQANTSSQRGVAVGASTAPQNQHPTDQHRRRWPWHLMRHEHINAYHVHIMCHEHMNTKCGKAASSGHQFRVTPGAQHKDRRAMKGNANTYKPMGSLQTETPMSTRAISTHSCSRQHQHQQCVCVAQGVSHAARAAPKHPYPPHSFLK